MKRLLLYFVLIFIASSCKGQRLDSGSIPPEEVRKPVFAGEFYPSDPKVLNNTLKTFFAQAKTPVLKNVLAIVIPHAGYIFSGQIAADALNQIKNNSYDLIVILGTNHTSADFTGISIYPKGAFGTPIGNADIDEQTASALLKKDPSFTTDLSVHAKEHSIEVQVPFIKYLFPETKILPIIVSGSSPEIYTKLANALSSILKNKKALIVASSDLSHYPNFDDALKTDRKTLKTITTLNLNEIGSEMRSQLDKKVANLLTCACGEAPVLAAIATAKDLGAKQGTIISYSNSGYNPVGDISKVVGYGAVAICGSNTTGTNTSTSDGESNVPIIGNLEEQATYSLTSKDKEELLTYSRSTLAQFFWTQTVPIPRGGNTPLMKIKRGAFVTLKLNGELRGCIGHMAEDIPIYATIGSMTLNAAFKDNRFDPLSPVELPKIRIEISVLTPFRRIGSADDIQLGRDGVLLKKGNYQAVFLPQVATETGWNKQTFLDQLSLKAGLNKGDWKEAELYTFQADIFSEKE
ncbi:MAG: AmmeMemoRadiSam system protein B [Bacteroidota bacterium]|nr:AmmeMemoRadiSam system protein B [Bacteroidota bacterium]MDP4195575.1 AmmeMemoRadiSam system protein B [Bacteroidota bacterium]